MSREKLFSVTKKDCTFKYYKGEGSGGQKKNKTENCCQCTHKKSGAQASSEEGRSKDFNTLNAFKKMTETPKFKSWLSLEVKKVTGELDKIKKKLDYEMENNVTVEFKKDGRWVNEDS